MSQLLFTIDGSYLYAIFGMTVFMLCYQYAMFAIMPLRPKHFTKNLLSQFLPEHKKMLGIENDDEA